MSDDLIDTLAAGLRPIRPGALSLRMVYGLAAGAVASVIVLLAWLGVRPDLALAVATPVFWVKFAYPLLLAVAGFYAVDRLSRPGLKAWEAAIFAALLFGLSTILGLTQLALAAPGEVGTLVMGGSALVCPFYIVALSAPVFVAILLVMRTLAPTRLTLAGLAAGGLAGGVGAWLYSFHCGENGLPFLAIWYTFGIAAMAAIGALSGRYLLRW